MAETKIQVQSGQNLFDVVLQEYGTLENIFNIFADNPQIEINTILTPLAEIKINSDGIGEEIIKTSYRRIDYFTNNADNLYTASLVRVPFKPNLAGDGNVMVDMSSIYLVLNLPG